MVGAPVSNEVEDTLEVIEHIPSLTSPAADLPSTPVVFWLIWNLNPERVKLDQLKDPRSNPESESVALSVADISKSVVDPSDLIVPFRAPASSTQFT